VNVIDTVIQFCLYLSAGSFVVFAIVTLV